jgi:hypothetical protein
MSSDDAPIIVNEEALTEAFVPTRLFHREGQIREPERCLKPTLKNRSIGYLGDNSFFEESFWRVPHKLNSTREKRGFADEDSINLGFNFHPAPRWATHKCPSQAWRRTLPAMRHLLRRKEDFSNSLPSMFCVIS